MLHITLLIACLPIILFLFVFSKDYSTMPEEGIVMNALAMVLVALGILLSYAVRRESFRSDVKTFVTERL